MRSVTAVRSVVSAAGETSEATALRFTSELHRALQPADGGRREGLRTALAPSGPVGGLDPDVRHDWPRGAAGVTGGLSAPAETGSRVSARGADALGHRFPDGGGAGRARRPRAAGGVPPDSVRDCRGSA